MRRILLPLIITLLLVFTLTGNCAWLAGWDNRILLTIDQTKIGTADLTWFPVTVLLTETNGHEVFTELTTDAEYLKVAFTKADGETQLYAEMEMFDVSESKGIYHVSKSDWVIDYDANTDFYMYYDKDHADNTDYIGAINTTAGGNVWDSNFKAVYHMVDETTSTILDSTSNNNDGTKKGAGEPASATGKVGLAQDFDGSDDYIGIADAASLDITDAITVETLCNLDSITDHVLMVKRDNLNYAWELSIYKGGETYARAMFRINANINLAETTHVLHADTDYYLAGTYNKDAGGAEEIKIYIDGANNGVGNYSTAIGTNNVNVSLGKRFYAGAEGYTNGGLDEIRISNSARSAAWIKATYNSIYNTLLNYGDEETAPAGEAAGNAIMFGINF